MVSHWACTCELWTDFPVDLRYILFRITEILIKLLKILYIVELKPFHHSVEYPYPCLRSLGIVIQQ
jgi:hypothetical protein